MDYQLVVLKGRSAAKTVRLADGVTTVGRQDGCELTVRSSQVSRKHCQLFEKKGLLLVKDLGSANGTFVNGKRIEEQRVLEPGDILTVGPIQFRIEAVGGAAPAAGGEVSSGSAPGRPAAADTAVPAAAKTEPSSDESIPLDEDDVLEFVLGGDDEPAPAAAKPAQAAPPGAAAKPAPPPPAAAAPAPAPAAKPKAAPAPPPKEEPPAEEAGADEAIAEFLMGIEIDEDDRR